MFSALFIAAALATSSPSTAATAAPSSSPERILALIRAKFRSHRPPPPYVVYVVERAQLNDQGFPDYVGSYTYHVWCRTLDRAALARKIYRAYARGTLEFQRPAFNEARDPGPPTADLFEPAPVHQHPLSFVPTPEAVESALPVIASVSVAGEFDYRVDSMDYQGEDIHLNIEPIRDPERNRLREIWADRHTYELHKIAATDKLFVEHGPTYAVAFTVTLGMLDGTPVITAVHGDVGDGYFGDGQKVDFTFRDISFPASLPDWYFDPRTYAAHQNDAPI
ncbi:MAG TPA: hypothetical protein VGD50_05315 [Candidatus Baltobacteraceae bacterium]